MHFKTIVLYSRSKLTFLFYGCENQPTGEKKTSVHQNAGFFEFQISLAY